MVFGPTRTTRATSARSRTRRASSRTRPRAGDEPDPSFLRNSWPNGTDPVAAKSLGDKDYGGELSYVRPLPPRLLDLRLD